MERLREIMLPSLVASATSVALYHFWLKEDIKEPIPLLGMDFPAYATVGISSFVGSVAGQFIGTEIKPRLPNYFGNLQEMIVGPSVDGITTYGAMVLMVHKDASFTNSFVMGAVGNVAGQWVNNSFFKA